MANVTNFRFALNASVDASPTFKKFGGEEVASNFIIVSDDETSICTGTAINDATRDGKPGIRIDLKVFQGGATTFFNGILMPKTSDNPKAPQHGGVLKNTKSGVEVSVSGWNMTGKSGDFIACRAEVKSSASTATSTDAVNAELATAASEDPGY
jgi:hypothetical protein